MVSRHHQKLIVAERETRVGCSNAPASRSRNACRVASIASGIDTAAHVIGSHCDGCRGHMRLLQDRLPMPGAACRPHPPAALRTYPGTAPHVASPYGSGSTAPPSVSSPLQTMQAPPYCRSPACELVVFKTVPPWRGAWMRSHQPMWDPLRLLPYVDADSCGRAVASDEMVAAVSGSRSRSGLRGLPTGNPTALRAVLTAAMNGADMIASMSG